MSASHTPPDPSRHREPTLEEAQHRWNDFVDAIGHELRTPLTAIIGFQELLEEGIYGELAEPCRGAVARIGISAHELLALLNGMVDLARPAEAPPELDLATVPLDAIVAEAAETGRRLAPERDVAWSDALHPGLGSIRSDARRLQRALFLGVLAAVRATPGGALHLSAEPADDGAILRLRGPAFDRLPEAPLAHIILDKPAEGGDRSLLRLCLAVDTLALVGCSVELLPGDAPTLLVHLRDGPRP
jgi:signal transduction histidine kinase